jgi:hypothetical protein
MRHYHNIPVSTTLKTHAYQEVKTGSFGLNVTRRICNSLYVTSQT